MESWYREGLKGGELVLLSENGFTTHEIAIQFLDHFIKHTNAGPDKPWKMLLFDNHGSHKTPQFILKCIRNHIVPRGFHAHLTHVMQPLDVGVFQPYKHWHNVAIQLAMERLDFDYNISSFLRDLEIGRAHV